MEKNRAGKWIIFAYGLPSHATPGLPITGDAANISANIRADGGVPNFVDDISPTELEAGYYIFDITASEANGDLLSLHPSSTTAHVQVIGVPGSVYTRPPNFSTMGIETDGDLTQVNSLAGHTAQTADHTAGIADVPTVAEFNARTLAAAAYFDPAVDPVANVTLVDTTTTNTDMRGTENAALATDLTTVDAIVDELKVAVITNAAGVDISADLADLPTVAEFEARTPTADQLAYMVRNAATAVPVTFTTAGGSTTLAVLNLVDGLVASSNDDQYSGRLLVFNIGTLKEVVTDITDYVGSTTTATVTAIPFAPTTVHTAVLM